MSKITIIGAGAVGATTAYTLCTHAIADEIVIIDINSQQAMGNALDIAHGIPLSKPVTLYSGTYADSADSDLIIITVGVPEKVGESRLIPLQKNIDILKDILPKALTYSPNACLLIVTNPVDLLTYAAHQISHLPHSRVIGLGTVIDTSRLNYFLSQVFQLDGRSIDGYVIGEHGDSQVIAWSKTTIAGCLIEDYAKVIRFPLDDDFKANIENQVKQTAFDVWKMKGPNCYSVADAIKVVAEAILRNERRILPVSSVLHGEYGLSDVSLSLPSIIGKNGIEKVLAVDLNDNELMKLQTSASLMKSFIQQLNL